MTYDTIKKIKIFSGNVIFIHDTLTIKASKLVLTTNPTGYEFAVLDAAPKQLVRFRQKQNNNNSNTWIEGQAKHIEYNQNTQLVKLFHKADIKLTNNDKIISEINGEFISYNHRTKFYSVNNNHTRHTQFSNNNGNITTMIQPNFNTLQKDE